jgi:CheY-like chemotaxis protein
MGTLIDSRWVRSILLVEDDEDFRLGLAEFLRGEGYFVTCAANGHEALGHLRAGGVPPSVVLLDLKMPVMSGWDLRAKMLEDSALSSIPVILLSGAVRPQDADALRAAATLQKPVDLKTLLTMLDGTLLDRCAVCAGIVAKGRKTVGAHGAIVTVMCASCAADEDAEDALSRGMQEVLDKVRRNHFRSRSAS